MASLDELDGAVADEVGVVADLLGGHLGFPYVRSSVAADVAEVVDRAGEVAEELVPAALERAEPGQEAAVPFAQQRSLVADAPQQRCQRRVLGWDADLRVGLCDRLGETSRQTTRIAAGVEGEARGRAHGRAAVRVREAQAVLGQLVEIRGRRLDRAEAGEIGPAEIVGEDEEDIGTLERPPSGGAEAFVCGARLRVAAEAETSGAGSERKPELAS
jgi:hypothetical protein